MSRDARPPLSLSLVSPSLSFSLPLPRSPSVALSLSLARALAPSLTRAPHASLSRLPPHRRSSVNGTHLGHNLADSKGARYCINLVSVAGRNPTGGADDDDSDTPSDWASVVQGGSAR